MKTEEQVRKAMAKAFRDRKSIEDDGYLTERFKCFKWVVSDDWPEWMYT